MLCREALVASCGCFVSCLFVLDVSHGIALAPCP
jgi:hypothetical protein